MLMDRERSEVGNGTRKVWTGVGESAKINELLKSNKGDETSNGISDELGVGVRMEGLERAGWRVPKMEMVTQVVRTWAWLSEEEMT